MIPGPKDVFNDLFICYQDLSDYIGLLNIKREFLGEPALIKCEKAEIYCKKARLLVQ